MVQTQYALLHNMVQIRAGQCVGIYCTCAIYLKYRYAISEKHNQNRLPRYRNIAIKSQIAQYSQSGAAKIHEISQKISINWPNLSQKSLQLIAFWALHAMQYYTANAISIGQTEPRSIFPKPPSPSLYPAMSFSTLTYIHSINL